MKIKSIILKSGIIDNLTISFDEKDTLIWSAKNSQGKTTLIRFILYALGFKIPSTLGVKMDDYESTTLFYDSNVELIRRGNMVSFSKEEEIIKFDLSKIDDFEKNQSVLFGIGNLRLLRNILGCFYIDQEKGWTLINRGKVISSAIQFNIEDFIASFSPSSLEKIETKIENLKAEENRYGAIFNIVKLSEGQRNDVKIDENYDVLIKKKSSIVLKINELETKINEYKSIMNNNVSFVDFIEKHKLMVRCKNDNFLLRKENIVDYMDNQTIIESSILFCEITLEKERKNLAEVDEQLAQYDGLFNIKDASEVFFNDIINLNLDQTNIEHLIAKIAIERSNLEKAKKDLIKANTRIVTRITNLIKVYASELGVFNEYLEAHGDYLFMNDLRKYSGASYHKVTLSFRMAYCKIVEEETGIILPIIIDSPGAGEMKQDGINDIINTVIKNFKNHQVIVSSIYKAEISHQFSKNITLSGGLFSGNNSF